MILKFLFLAFTSFIATIGFAQVSQTEQTLSIIKPEAVSNNDIGGIISYIEGGNLQVIAIKMTKLTEEQAKNFYEVHKDRPFYSELVNYMSSGPVVVMALEGRDAVARYRKIMGATDPNKAAPGTIRADFGSNITHNAVHGSDSVENAAKEIGFFFKSNEIFSRPLVQSQHDQNQS